MAIATCYSNIENDMVAIQWSQRPNDLPLDAVNQALARLYTNPDLAPYLYAVYNGNTEVGLLVAGNFHPGTEVYGPDGKAIPQADAGAEIAAVWQDIVDSNKAAPLTGDLAPFTVQV